ncbi:Exo5p KNAG_0A03850 [Huiozyma naganishii CBS 8797]|uniref:Exonuclease V, mitochondrial n=1 Tax=Huiozyma naganishii (strain ATCC MYA-139 / BCRC 22969 / CBS 8797 / KCTC 17520 / NBRC 10181 / NCYC 3082 / Yp74L-3) TaxID=1071383 RepID=J7QZW7_HUIN7|nr:hypothetical protein KNAG_0A03850 [Kazachstania naganishii CBS 8797]CCK68065.1 hypothetical protein KNAG_0A03850 [Kazachstania naganishii CBS 8797]
MLKWRVKPRWIRRNLHCNKRVNEMTSLEHPKANQDLTDLTLDEQKTIKELSFFKDKQLQQVVLSTKKLNSKDNYILGKIGVVREIFGESTTHPGYLSYKLPDTKPNPYRDGLSKCTFSERQNRLSVTSLLTKSWCELRTAYDIYSQKPRFATSRIISGAKQHSTLESTIYKIDDDWLEFNQRLNVPTFKLLEGWSDTLHRLMTLFINGEAREVLCHGYMDSSDDNGTFLSGEKIEYWQRMFDSGRTESPDTDPASKFVLVSGIIDHLVLRSKRSENLIVNQKYLEGTADVMKVIEGLQAKVSTPQAQNDWEIVVGDVKTRNVYQVPTQSSVVKASKLQVMYYRFFLDILGQAADTTYYSLLINAQKRGLDVDAPINPLNALSLMVRHPFLIPDMNRLKHGVSINFEPFDICNEADNKVFYDLTPYKELLTSDNSEHLREFCKKWEKPLTLRYFAARLSQFYNLMGGLLSDKLMIEYYCFGKNFHNIDFTYSHDNLCQHHASSSKFWFGKRPIEPIKPNLKNLVTYCKYCDYSSVCLWKREAEEACGQLGKDLQNVISEIY